MPKWLDWIYVSNESKKETGMVLTPYKKEDSVELARIRNTDGVRKTYLNRRTTPDKLHDNHTRDMESKVDPWTFYTVRLDGKIIGEVGIHVLHKTRECRIPYYLDPDVHGKGYGTMLIGKVIEMCRTIKDVDKISAYVIKENIASQRVLLKNGFKLKKVITYPTYQYMYEYKL